MQKQPENAQELRPIECPPVVVFDGACPLCSREIAHYRRRVGAQGIRWVDASSDPDSLVQLGLSQEQALARFHVRDAQSQWQIGAYGFVELWSHLRPYHLFARLIRKLRLSAFLDRLYALFLRWRNRCRCGSAH